MITAKDCRDLARFFWLLTPNTSPFMVRIGYSIYDRFVRDLRPTQPTLMTFRYGDDINLNYFVMRLDLNLGPEEFSASNAAPTAAVKPNLTA